MASKYGLHWVRDAPASSSDDLLPTIHENEPHAEDDEDDDEDDFRFNDFVCNSEESSDSGATSSPDVGISLGYDRLNSVRSSLDEDSAAELMTLLSPEQHLELLHRRSSLNNDWRSNQMISEAVGLLSGASHHDLAMEWSMLCQDCTDCWTATDLQLAAELGKTLLERNKELENTIKQQQAIIEDQAQEIEYLSKQASILRDVNDSRLKIYEQLEVSISELEETNKKLSEESCSDKQTIKLLYGNINRLEARCDDLQRFVDEYSAASERQRRRKERRRARFHPEHDDDDEDRDDQQEAEEEEDEDHHREVPMDRFSLTWPDLHNSENEAASGHFSCADGSEQEALMEREEQQQQKQPAASSLIKGSAASSSSSGSPIYSSGYSSSSVESNQPPEKLIAQDKAKKLQQASCVETSSLSCGTNDWTSTTTDYQHLESLQMECYELKDRLSELTRVLSGATNENKRLKLEVEAFREPFLHDTYHHQSVEEEVQSIDDVVSGKLCRKCLGLVDASPSALLSSAGSMMTQSLMHELHDFGRRSHWQSSLPWLDRCFLSLTALALTLAFFASLAKALASL